MKKCLLLLPLFITYNLLFAQTRFFIQPEMTVGSLLDDSRLELNYFHGYITRKSTFEINNLQTQRTYWSYGMGIKGGIILNDLLHLQTGVRFRKIITEGMLLCCPSCNCIDATELTLLQVEFLEIPVGFRFNILKNSRVQPYISSEVFWARALNQKNDLYKSEISWAGESNRKYLDVFRIAYKAGVSYKMGESKNWEISLQSGLNMNLGKQKSYPRYDFREVTAEVGVLRAF